MNSDAIISKFLSGGAYTNINHSVLLGLGGDVTAAFLLHKLMTSYDYFNRENALSRDGWFFQTSEDIEKGCGISDCKQRRALTFLEKQGLIEMKLMGWPPKRHFKVYPNKIVELIEYRPLDKVVAPPPETKEEFYQKMNTAFRDLIWSGAQKYIGNIPKWMGYFMYRWAKLFTFDWTSKDYGIARNYLMKRYEKKPFDFYRFNDFFEHARTLGQGAWIPTIQDFINFDRINPEKPFSQQKSYDRIIQENKEI